MFIQISYKYLHYSMRSFSFAIYHYVTICFNLYAYFFLDWLFLNGQCYIIVVTRPMLLKFFSLSNSTLDFYLLNFDYFSFLKWTLFCNFTWIDLILFVWCEKGNERERKIFFISCFGNFFLFLCFWDLFGSLINQ